MRTSTAALAEAREAFARHAWRAAAAGYEAATGDLDLDDIEHYAFARNLLGEDEAGRDLLGRGYREALRAGEKPRAARFAFWLGYGLLFAGRMAEASGWFTRAGQLVGNREECAEWGYLLMPQGIEQLGAGNAGAAESIFAEAQGIGMRCGDVNLVAMAGHGRGRSLIRLGRVADGMSVLDEVMIAATSGEVEPVAIGDLYCGVLEACHEVFDLRRAREWTGALSRWCEGQDELVRYRGPCLVYRAEVMQFHGAWTEALAEAQRACEWLSLPATPEGAGDAFYRIAELRRLRGEYREAEEAYRQASLLGRRPEPGLPLLWLAEGQAEAARAAIERALAEEQDTSRLPGLLDAGVQIALELRDVDRARGYAQGLGRLAAALGAPAVRAMAAMAEGAVLLVAGEPLRALVPLRSAWMEWQRLEAPYDAARVRRLLAVAYRELGDHPSAAMELDAARWGFQQLGAAPELRTVERLLHGAVAQTPGPLTAREVEVLRLLATGLTNKEIGTALVISEHTVARHVQNMLAKLNQPSRAALAAYAVEHGLVDHATTQNSPPTLRIFG